MKLTNVRHTDSDRASGAKAVTPKVSSERACLRGEWSTLKRVASSSSMGGTDVVSSLLVLGQVEAQLKASKGLQVALSFRALQRASADSATKMVRSTVDLEATSTPGFYFGQLKGSGSVLVELNQGKIASIILDLSNQTKFSGTRLRTI
jgi:hypothetical protein